MQNFFNNAFFSLSMHQLFNRTVMLQPENQNEAPVHKMLRLAGQL